MLVGIYDLKDPNGGDLVRHQAYENILAYNGISSIRLRVEQPDFWEKVDELYLFIMRFRHVDSHLALARDLLPIIEEQHNVRCYPNKNTAWHYDDKIKQYLLLRPLGFPITESWIFYEKERALEWVERAQYPVVFKLRGGAGSRNVILVSKAAQAQSLVKRMFGRGVIPENFVNFATLRFKHFNPYLEFRSMCGKLRYRSKGIDVSSFWQIQKNYVLFQKFLPGNAWDTRVTVIGGRAFAFRRMVRDSDFRASGSGRIDYDPAQIDTRSIEIAFKVSKEMGFQSMAYDFLRNEEGEPEFCEISYAYVSAPVHNCSGYWDPDLNWHEGKQWWPEHLHLIDALELPDLKMPEMDY